MATKLFQMPRPDDNQINPAFKWTTAEDVTMRGLKKYLCSDGGQTNGEACVTCESQCAFGRRFIGLDLVMGKREAQAIERLNKIYTAYNKTTGEVLGEYEKRVEAARAYGIKNPGNITRASENNWAAGGVYWRIRDAGHFKATEGNGTTLGTT